MPGHPGQRKSVFPEPHDAAIAGLVLYLGIVVVTSLKDISPGLPGLLLSSALQLGVAAGGAYVFAQWRQAERRCREQTDAVLAVPSVAILTTDPEGVITSWNAGAETIFGYRREEAIGQSIGILYYPSEHPDPSWETSLHDAETRGAADENAWKRRKNGSRLWANMVVSAVRDEDRRASSYVIVARDFTAWKIGVDHVVDQCTTFETIVESTFQIISLKNAILQYEFINAAGALHFGFSQEEIEGKTDSEIMPTALAQLSIAYDDKVLATGTPLTVIEEHEIRGFKRRYLTYRYPWRNGAGKARGVITVSTDITDCPEFLRSRSRAGRKKNVDSPVLIQ